MTEITRRQFAVALFAVVAVVLLGGRALRADAGAGTAGELPAAGFTAGATGAGAPDGAATGATGSDAVELTASTERLLVHVAGRVRRPGVYELPAGARVQDALDEAGGGRAGADLDALNLAAKVTDGQQVLVARRGAGGSAAVAGAASSPGGGASGTAGATSAAGGAGAAGAAGGAGGPAGATVDVNQADVTQLEVLNGVGPAIAAKIVDWRTQNGPFKTVDDLALVPGIGPKKLEAMRPQVTV